VGPEKQSESGANEPRSLERLEGTWIREGLPPPWRSGVEAGGCVVVATVTTKD